jgi:hypothetical protein
MAAKCVYGQLKEDDTGQGDPGPGIGNHNRNVRGSCSNRFQCGTDSYSPTIDSLAAQVALAAVHRPTAQRFRMVLATGGP